MPMLAHAERAKAETQMRRNALCTNSLLHVRIIGTAAAFGRYPGDVLRGILDVAGFAMNAVLRVDLESGAVRLLDDLVNAGGTVSLRRFRIFRQIDADGNGRILQHKVNRLVLLV